MPLYTTKKKQKIPSGNVFIEVTFRSPKNLGLLLVTPTKAKLLKDLDTLGKMDPYCKVTVGKQAPMKTKPCSGGGKTPIWNQIDV